MVSTAQATTVPLLVPLLLLLDDVVGARVAVGEGVAPGEVVAVEDVVEEEAGAGVGDGVVVLEESSSVVAASLVILRQKRRRSRAGHGVRGAGGDVNCIAPKAFVAWTTAQDKDKWARRQSE